MQKEQVLNTFQGLPTWARGIIAVAVVGGVGYLAYKIYKKLQEGSRLADAELVSNLAEDEYTKLLKKGKKLSHPTSKYANDVARIVSLMSDCESTWSEYEVVDIIKETVKQPIDWYYLVKVFDSRLIPDCGTGDTPYSLPELLLDQLDSMWWYVGTTSIDDVKEHLRKIGISI